MVDARHRVEETRQELQAREAEIRRHPYLDALAAGAVSREELRRFAGQQYHIIGSDLRAMALVIVKADSAETREFFWGGIQGERGALEALETFATALAMPAGEPPGARADPRGIRVQCLCRLARPLRLVRRVCRRLPGESRSVGVELRPDEPGAEGAIPDEGWGRRFL